MRLIRKVSLNTIVAYQKSVSGGGKLPDFIFSSKKDGEKSSHKLEAENVEQWTELGKRLTEIFTPMIYMFDLNGKVISCNQAAEKVTGYKAQEIMGKKDIWKSIISNPLLRDDVLKRFNEMAEGLVITGMKTSIKAKDGQEKLIFWNGLRLEDDGEVMGIAIIGQEMAEHQRREEENGEHEKELCRSLIELSDLLILGLNPNGEIKNLNRGAECLIGRPFEEILGMNFFDLLIPTNVKETFQNHVNAMVKGEKTELLEGPMLTRSGDKLVIQWSWSVITGKSDKVESIIALGRDITYDRWLEDQMLLFMDAIESSNDGIAIFDKRGHLIFANPALLDMYGLRLHDVRGRLYKDFLLETVELPQNLTDWDGWRGRITLVRSDGSSFPAAISVAPVSDREGAEPNATIAIVRDISQTLEYEQKLEALNRELESFAYTISHDLRAPIRAIQGFSLALQEDQGHLLDDNGKRYLERIRNISIEMDGLVLDLLDYSRIGRIFSSPETVDLGKLVTESYEELEPQVHGRNVKFTKVGSFPVIVCERIRIKQIFTNLLSNSLKYSGENPSIEVGCIDRGPEYEFYVQDNGKGFDTNYVDRLFEPFYRLDKSVEGTGIGLATIKKIVETNGGKIWAQSKPGEGSTFSFTLPKNEH